MPWKLDDAGNVVTDGGKPVFVYADGRESGMDGDGTVATIGRLQAEAKTHREAKEAAESRLKGFEGIDDPAAAREALKIAANLDAKKLVDAGEVEKVKTEVAKAIEARYQPFVEKATQLEQALHAEKIGGSFARSKFITDTFAIPADMVQARFGGNFSLENGQIVATDQHGNKIFSRARPGELADFDEALATLLDAYPYKDQITKGSGASGGGARGGSGAGGAGGKTISRAAFNSLPPLEQAAYARSGGKVVD